VLERDSGFHRIFATGLTFEALQGVLGDVDDYERIAQAAALLAARDLDTRVHNDPLDELPLDIPLSAYEVRRLVLNNSSDLPSIEPGDDVYSPFDT
jgi:hypothetical protein